MPRYVFEIEAGDGFPDRFEIDLANREVARMHAIDLASDRLQHPEASSGSVVVCIAIMDDTGEILDTLRSIAL